MPLISRLREDPVQISGSRLLRLALPALLCVLLLAVVGTILASVSPPAAKRDISDALVAGALDLTAGDPAHNQAIQSLMVALEKDGYQINGAKPLAEDCWAVLRGRQSVFSPHESRFPMEWRLAVCAHRQATPHSYLATRLPEQGFSPELVETLTEEWVHYSTPLPSDVITTAQQLLAKVPSYHAQDRDAMPTCRTDTSDACVVLREWRTGGTNSEDTNAHYYLRLKQLTDRYEVAVELHDERASAGNAATCWLCIDFVRLEKSDSK